MSGSFYEVKKPMNEMHYVCMFCTEYVREREEPSAS
jgi:hypothetical protein